MRIAFIARSFVNPSETFVRDLAQRLAERHTLRVFCASKRFDAPSLDISTVPFAVERSMRRRDRAWARIRGVDLEVALFRRREAAVLQYLAPEVQAFSPDVVYCDYGTMAVFLDRMCRELGIPLVFHFHGYDASLALNNPRYREHVSSMMRAGTPFIAPSQHVARRMRIIAAADAAAVIPCGPDLERIRALSAVEKTAFPSVVAVGRLVEKKNPVALIEAFSCTRERHPTAHLTMIGEGSERERVEERIALLGLKRAVTLAGTLSHERVLETMASSWVFAQHSVTAGNGDQEGMPVAILEAMALGLPVVATVHSGIPEAVSEGKTGYLVREHDFETMAKRIDALLDDGERRARMGQAGAQKVVRLALPRRVEAVEGVLRQACARGAK